MQPDEEFRSRLQHELDDRSAPPVGTLAADALGAGHKMRRRQRTLRAVGGSAAVVAVAVGSVTLSGAFGSDSATSVAGSGGGRSSVTPAPTASSSQRTPSPVPSSSSSGPGAPSSSSSGPGAPSSSSSAPATSTSLPIPSSWSVPPAAVVADPAWVTPRAIIAELRKLLPAGDTTSAYSGDYAYAGGDPREQWAVDGKMTVTTPKGTSELAVTLHKYDGIPQGGGCQGATLCGSKTLPDGTRVIVRHDWESPDTTKKGAYVWVIRKDGMSAQVTVRDQSLWTDDQLFALASSADFGSLKMDKTFVQHAEATVNGDFMNPPA